MKAPRANYPCACYHMLREQTHTLCEQTGTGRTRVSGASILENRRYVARSNAICLRSMMQWPRLKTLPNCQHNAGMDIVVFMVSQTYSCTECEGRGGPARGPARRDVAALGQPVRTAKTLPCVNRESQTSQKGVRPMSRTQACTRRQLLLQQSRHCSPTAVTTCRRAHTTAGKLVHGPSQGVPLQSLTRLELDAVESDGSYTPRKR